jgi:hypothetical protein
MSFIHYVVDLETGEEISYRQFFYRQEFPKDAVAIIGKPKTDRQKILDDFLRCGVVVKPTFLGVKNYRCLNCGLLVRPTGKIVPMEETKGVVYSCKLCHKEYMIVINNHLYKGKQSSGSQEI